MPCNPRSVRGTHVDIAWARVKNRAVGVAHIGRVTAASVYQAFGVSGASSGVHQEDRIFGRHGFRCTNGGLILQECMPRDVSLRCPRYLRMRSLKDYDVRDLGCVL